jgi:hypothetical protein
VGQGSNPRSLARNPCQGEIYVCVCEQIRHAHTHTLTHSHTHTHTIHTQTSQIDLLVENCGRINYGRPPLLDRKGLSSVLYNSQAVSNLQIVSLPLGEDFLAALATEVESVGTMLNGDEGDSELSVPAFFFATVAVNKLCDTFVSTTPWGKGAFFINNFNLGR